MSNAVGEYVKEVRDVSFPSAEYCFGVSALAKGKEETPKKNKGGSKKKK